MRAGGHRFAIPWNSPLSETVGLKINTRVF